MKPIDRFVLRATRHNLTKPGWLRGAHEPHASLANNRSSHLHEPVRLGQFGLVGTSDMTIKPCGRCANEAWRRARLSIAMRSSICISKMIQSAHAGPCDGWSAKANQRLGPPAPIPIQKWQLVEKIESDYRAEFPQDPRLPWLSWQAARAELLRAQQALARWLATPASVPQRDQALQSVRKVQTLVEALEKDIKERLATLAEPLRTQSTSHQSRTA